MCVNEYQNSIAYIISRVCVWWVQKERRKFHHLNFALNRSICFEAIQNEELFVFTIQFFFCSPGSVLYNLNYWIIFSLLMYLFMFVLLCVCGGAHVMSIYLHNAPHKFAEVNEWASTKETFQFARIHFFYYAWYIFLSLVCLLASMHCVYSA